MMSPLQSRTPANRRATNNEPGVIASEGLLALIAAGKVSSQARDGVAPAQIQPASLDLTLSARAWRVRASFLPSSRRTVRERLDDGLKMHAVDLSNGAILERGCVYLVELNETLALPPQLEGAANPKSSTGRIDVFVRLVTDQATAFDEVRAGYTGPLYAEISPRSFSILARAGSSLNQLRLKSGKCNLDDGELKQLHETTPISDGHDVDIQNGLGVRVHLEGAHDKLVGFRARRHSGLIDVDKTGALDHEDFFEPIYAPRSGFIILDPDEFYILASREMLTIPVHTAAEMTPISPGLGEFRVHYAGFFDPGFGVDAPSRGVLEVRSHDAPFVLEHGQLVARLVYERMAEPPTTVYGKRIQSNYQGQGLKLSKHFR